MEVKIFIYYGVMVEIGRSLIDLMLIDESHKIKSIERAKDGFNLVLDIENFEDKEAIPMLIYDRKDIFPIIIINNKYIEKYTKEGSNKIDGTLLYYNHKTNKLDRII